MPAESNLQTKILNDIESWGAKSMVFKIMKCNINGVPDVFFTTVFSGPVFLELKAPRKKPDPHQELIINKLRKCGVPAFSCDSWERWVEIKNELNLTKTNIANAARLFKK